MSFLSLALTTFIVILVFGEFKLTKGKEISRNIYESHEANRTKRSVQQVKLCGNQLINMLRIICRIYHLDKGTVRFRPDSEDLGINSIQKRRKRSLENYSIRRHVSNLVSQIGQGLSYQCCATSCNLQQLLGAC